MKTEHVPSLRPIDANEFLPPIRRWMVAAGLVLMGAVGSAIALAAVLPYNVTVKAAATVRPQGELRLVQASRDGAIASIEVEANQPVQQGQVIARLDPSLLNAQQRQLQGSTQQARVQLTQMQAQIRLLDTQISAEGRSLDRSIGIAQTELTVSQQQLQQQQATVAADLADAEAARAFAQSEMRRYQQLVASGAVSQLQLEEKQAAVQSAEAQVARARATLAPTDGVVAIAQQRIAQEESRSRAALATLAREREALVQQEAELHAQLLREQAELQRVETELQDTAIRATSNGILFQLNLRNPNQVVRSGETIAAIAPDPAALVLNATVATQDINTVSIGQTAQLRLEACPVANFGTLQGTVVAISPDALTPNLSDRTPTATALAPSATDSYFEVLIQPSRSTLQRSNQSCPLQAGMKADADIVARQETMLQLILRKARLLAS